MAGDAGKTRIDIVEDELRMAGMEPSAAAHFAQELIVEHPYARRFGLDHLTRQIERRGVETDTARATATTLLSIELLGQGREFASLHRELERLGVDAHEAMSGALDGARAYREIRALDPRRLQEPTWAPMALILAGSCIAALIVMSQL